MPKPRPRRRRPEEFGLIHTADSDDDTNSVSLAQYTSLHLAAGLSRAAGAAGPEASDYAQAASELAHMLSGCYRAAEKAAAGAMFDDAMLAAKLVQGLDTDKQLAAASHLHRAARLALPHAKRLSFDKEFKRAAIVQGRAARKHDAEARDIHDDVFQPTGIGVRPPRYCPPRHRHAF